VRNLYLAQVVDYYGPNKFLPLAISYQWLSASRDPLVRDRWRVSDVLIEKLPVDAWVDAMEDPGMVLMSCYVWNWEYNQTLAKSIKQKWPLCRICIGGPQVNKNDPSLIRNMPWFDVAVLGENEMALPRILSTDDVSEWTKIPGVVTALTEIIIEPERTQDLDDLPSPILSGFYDWIMEKYQSRSQESIMWQVTYETMRGCPYHCAFCDIGDAYWNKTYFFSMDRIYQEIQWMAQKKIEYVSVCDSNWGISARDKDITQWVIDAKKSHGYPKFWDVTWAKNNTERVREIAMMDHEANTRLFKGITFALQSLNQSTLDQVKRFNLRDSVIHDSMLYFKKSQISTYSEMIWPMPGETLNSFKSGMQKLIDMGQKDFVMVHPLVLTPNSPMGQKDYIIKHDLEYRTVPLDTFWLKIEDPDSYVVEKVDAVYSTSSADFNDTLQGHLFAHWLIVMYYYGWAHVIIEFIVNDLGIQHRDVIQALIDYLEKNPDTLLGQEHRITKQCLTGVFDNGDFWGRQVRANDVYWEYKSATSVILHQNRSQLAKELERFILQEFCIQNKHLIDLNENLCFDWNQKYPLRGKYDPVLLQKTLNISASDIEFDHWDKNITNENDFLHKAYHYQRKNRFWRCDVRIVE